MTEVTSPRRRVGRRRRLLLAVVTLSPTTRRRRAAVTRRSPHAPDLLGVLPGPTGQLCFVAPRRRPRRLGRARAAGGHRARRRRADPGLVRRRHRPGSTSTTRSACPAPGRSRWSRSASTTPTSPSPSCRRCCRVVSTATASSPPIGADADAGPRELIGSARRTPARRAGSATRTPTCRSPGSPAAVARRHRPDPRRRAGQGRPRPRPRGDHRCRPVDERFLLRHLAAAYPDCWTFAVEGLVGASPELLIRRRGRRDRVPGAGRHGLAGTRRRRRGGPSCWAAEGHRRARVRGAVGGRGARPRSGHAHGAGRTPQPLELANLVHLSTDITGVLDEPRRCRPRSTWPPGCTRPPRSAAARRTSPGR